VDGLPSRGGLTMGTKHKGGFSKLKSSPDLSADLRSMPNQSSFAILKICVVRL
jgi:hypothetical protein